MELLLAAALVIFVPFLVAFIAGNLRRPTSGLASLAIVVVSAAMLPVLLFLGAQQADAITAAGSYYVMPVLFLVSAIPAGLGLQAAELLRDKDKS